VAPHPDTHRRENFKSHNEHETLPPPPVYEESKAVVYPEQTEIEMLTKIQILDSQVHVLTVTGNEKLRWFPFLVRFSVRHIVTSVEVRTFFPN
jgi:pyruvate-formate lyase-activating enzyme